VATLLVLGASVSQLPAIRYGRESGHRVVAVDGDPNAVGFRFADVAEAVDFADVGRVTAVGARHHVDGVLAVCSDRAVHPAAAVAEALSLPSIGADVAHAMTDKAVMRDTLAAAGVRQPAYRVLEWPDTRPGRRFRPSVLKPADSGGQRGVFRIESPADLEQHLRETLSFSHTRRAILEDYVEGSELNGIVVVRNGEPTLLTLSDRLRPEGQGFGVGWIHSFPSALDDRALDDARDVAFAAVSALGLRNGIAFPQLIVDGDGDAWLVEIAARIPAGQMADLVSFAVGVNLYEVAIRQALGLPVPDELIAPKHETPVAIRFLTADPGVLPVGTVEAIDGIDAVRASDGVLAVDLYFGPGHVIRPLQVDADRNGYVIATGADPPDALARADAAAAKLLVRVS
jgi:biotin carboxylase